MKNHHALFCLIAICAGFSAFQSSRWVRISLKLDEDSFDKDASILLPAQVKQLPGSESMKHFVAEDTAGTYSVIAFKLLTYDGIHNNWRKTIYEEILKYSVDSTDEKIVNRSAISLGCYPGVEFTIKGNSTDVKQPYFIYKCCVVGEETAYILSFSPADKGRHNGMQRTPFFSSLTFRTLTERGVK